MEFQQDLDMDQTAESLEDLVKETKLAKFLFVGYLLHHAFSFAQDSWQHILDLVVGFFYTKMKILSKNDIMEGVNVSLAHFHDTLIDYPNSRDYCVQLFERMRDAELMTEEQVGTYTKHIDNLKEIETETKDEA